MANTAAEGKCIARVDDKVIFIPFAAPGDVADIQTTFEKKSYYEAKITNLITPSSLRVTPFCQHFGVCGGCKWQHLNYESQLEMKQQQVKDALERIGKVEVEKHLPVAGSDKQQFYRNKLEFTFSNKAWEEIFDKDSPKGIDALGFHVPGRFDKVMPIETCWLMPEPANSIRLAINDFARSRNWDYFDIRGQQGFLRNVMMRCSNLGDWLIVLIVFHEDREKIDLLFNHLQDSFKEITSLCYVVNEKKNDSWNDLEVQTWSGKGYMEEKMEDLTFKIRPQSFFQTNSEQALRLYEITRDFAGLTGNELVYDLYTGTGTIAQFVAKKARKVVGIEYVESAIKDAKENASRNGLSHTHFFAGDMKDVLNDEFVNTHGAPDVIITDPPRDGMHADVVAKIIELKPKRVVYVSCNPATQARDLAMMKEHYRVSAVQPVDMFPHTHHVESVALLELI